MTDPLGPQTPADLSPEASPDTSPDTAPDTAGNAAADASPLAPQETPGEAAINDQEQAPEIDDLEVLLNRLRPLMQKVRNAGGMSLMEADGFLHGLVCLPGRKDPAMFMAHILSGQDDSMLLDSQELHEVLELLLERYFMLADMVEDGAFYPDPLILPPDMYDAYFAKYMEKQEGKEDEAAEDEAAEDEATEDEAEEDETAGNEAAEDKKEATLSPPLTDEERERLNALEADVARRQIQESKEWSKGFLAALEKWGAMERILSDNDASPLLMPLLSLLRNLRLADEGDLEKERPLATEEREKVLLVLPIMIEELHTFLHSPVVKKRKISRNDPCPCGSGKKYKKCCLNKPGSAQA